MRRHYSDKDRAEALAVLRAVGGDLSQAARDCGIPRKTLASWRAQPALAAPADVRQTKEDDLANRWSEVRDLAIIRAKEQLEAGGKLGLRDLTILAGVGTDKVNLLTGKSTERIEVTNLADFLRTTSGTERPIPGVYSPGSVPIVPKPQAVALSN